ncbi:MAG: hypothetical protein EBT92_17990 [Planctomycetes bacterium]|nr:hypothetical protein [Planctomycetota bacterium]NBY01171.1 hypothetical protein [Planctomycetota bacterium]
MAKFPIAPFLFVFNVILDVHMIQYLKPFFIALSLLVLIAGCGSDREKGMNKDKGFPRTEIPKAEKKKGTETKSLETKGTETKSPETK